MCAIVCTSSFAGATTASKEEEAREYFDAHGHWPDEAVACASTPNGNRTRATAVKGLRANRYTMGARPTV